MRTAGLANSIVVGFPGPATNGVITLEYYDTSAPIPTTFLLPCAGTGKVVYAPEPTSPTAKSDVVTVTFINIAV